MPGERKTNLIAEISEAELACRIAEAGHGLPRPLGATAEQALACLDPQSREWTLAMARAAIKYFGECIAALRAPN